MLDPKKARMLVLLDALPDGTELIASSNAFPPAA